MDKSRVLYSVYSSLGSLLTICCSNIKSNQAKQCGGCWEQARMSRHSGALETGRHGPGPARIPHRKRPPLTSFLLSSTLRCSCSRASKLQAAQTEDSATDNSFLTFNPYDSPERRSLRSPSLRAVRPVRSLSNIQATIIVMYLIAFHLAFWGT